MANAGSCEAGCRYWQRWEGRYRCTHPQKEAHWRVPMAGNCFGFNHEWEPAPRRGKPGRRQMAFGGDVALPLDAPCEVTT